MADDDLVLRLRQVARQHDNVAQRHDDAAETLRQAVLAIEGAQKILTDSHKRADALLRDDRHEATPEELRRALEDVVAAQAALTKSRKRGETLFSRDGFRRIAESEVLTARSSPAEYQSAKPLSTRRMLVALLSETPDRDWSMREVAAEYAARKTPIGGVRVSHNLHVAAQDAVRAGEIEKVERGRYRATARHDVGGGTESSTEESSADDKEVSTSNAI